MRQLVIPEQSPTAPPSVRYEDESTAPIYPKFMTTKVDDTRRKKAALAMAASQVGHSARPPACELNHSRALASSTLVPS